MLFRQLFIDAISNELRDSEYHLIGDGFYIYRREAGLVFGFSFDVFMGGSDFYIYGGAVSFCQEIDVLPKRKLLIRGYDVSTYASRCGMKSFSNANYAEDDYRTKRYTKDKISRAIERNIAVFRETLLSDILNIDSLEDYYNFKVKADGFGYYVSVPFPIVDSFYLCIELEKFREASHIYLMMLKRNDESVHDINRHMKLQSVDYVIKALDKLYAAQSVFVNSLDRLDKESKIIEDILIENKGFLLEQLQKRIAISREKCDAFFA